MVEDHIALRVDWVLMLKNSDPRMVRDRKCEWREEVQGDEKIENMLMVEENTDLQSFYGSGLGERTKAEGRTRAWKEVAT